MYEFCYDAGSMERSRFFGFSKGVSIVIGNHGWPPWRGPVMHGAPQRQAPGSGRAVFAKPRNSAGGIALAAFVSKTQLAAGSGPAPPGPYRA
jgi:hypothetical protein